MTRGEDRIKGEKNKHYHFSSMSNDASCDLTCKGDKLKLHDTCHNPKGKCQKQITFTPKEFQLGGIGFKSTRKKIRTEKTWNILSKPGLKIATPINSTGVAAKTKKPQLVAVTSKSLKSLSGGKFLSLTDMQSGAG